MRWVICPMGGAVEEWCHALQLGRRYGLATFGLRWNKGVACGIEKAWMLR